MITWTRVVSAVLTAVLLAGLAPVAGAQQMQTPPAPVQPGAQPAQPAPPAPDLFQETLKAERSGEASKGTYDAGAVAVNVFLVPGRAITCLLGGVAGLVVLAATLGSRYSAAANAVNEGCGGKWVVTGDDLRPEGSERYTHLEMEKR